MACGHTAQGTVGRTDKPVCVICSCFEVAKEKPVLKGRKAVCPCCKKKVDSSLDLAFFEYRADRETDSFYCGCRGWD